MSSTSSLKRNMNKNKSKKIQVLSALLEGRSEEQLQQESSQTRENGLRLVVRARAAMPDEFSSVPIKTVPQVPVELKLRSAIARKLSASKRAPMQILLNDSEFTGIELESDSETAPESYHYLPGQYIISPEFIRVEDRSVVRSCSAFL